MFKKTISTRNWKLIDINNYCFENDVSWDLKEEEIVLYEINKIN